MKKLLLFSVMMLAGVLCLAQNQNNTAGIYYYDTNSYGVMQRDSADYYRVVESDNSFKDYYSKDNTLRAKGKLLSIDASDDAKTVFDGEFTAYYPSGKIWIKQFFKDGKNDGEYTEYNEDGLIKQHEFYDKGVLIKDYYAQSSGEEPFADDAIKGNYESGDITASDLKTYKGNDGQIIRAYAVNGLYVSVNVAYQHYFGRYYVLQVFIQNKSSEDAYFSFDDTSIKSSNGRIKLFTYNDFQRRMRSRQGWAQFGLTAASVATAITLEAITDDAFYRQDRRHRRTLGRDIAHDMSVFLIRQSAAVGSILAANMINSGNAKVLNKELGYLKNYVIKPNTSVTGYAYAKYNSGAKQLLVNLPINGKIYQFPVNVTDIRDVK